MSTRRAAIAAIVIAATASASVPLNGPPMSDAALASATVLPAEHQSGFMLGAVRPADTALLGAPIDGLLLNVAVEEGQRVRQGELIAVIDDRAAAATVAAARHTASLTAEIDRATAERDLAKTQRDRTERALRAGGANEYELIEADARLRSAEATLTAAHDTQKQAELQLELAVARLERHRIRAPFDGVVTRLHTSSGESATMGAPVATVESIDHLEAELYLPAAFALELRPGSIIALAIEAGQTIIVPAEVTYTEPRIDPASRTIRTVVALPDKQRGLVAGAIARPANAAEHTAATALGALTAVDVP